MRNPKYIEQLFVNLDRESATEMRTYFEKNMVHVDLNYPRANPVVPGIYIILKSETEGQAFLNDHMSTGEVPDGTGYDDWDEEILGGGTVFGAASTSSSAGEGSVVYGPALARSATLNTLVIDGNAWAVDTYRGGGRTIHIIDGTGTGQKRNIVANGPSTIMVNPNWTTLPDTTSQFVIRGPEKELVGEPRGLYKNQTSQFLERKGSYYSTSYQILVIGPNQEQTIYLSIIVKSILTYSRMFLEGQGIINMRLGASDFVPRKEYYPDYAYMRAIEVNFLYPFSIYVEPEYATELRLVLESTCQCGTLTIVSDTEVQ